MHCKHRGTKEYTCSARTRKQPRVRHAISAAQHACTGEGCNSDINRPVGLNKVLLQNSNSRTRACNLVET
jgi:hypothetical protein